MTRYFFLKLELQSWTDKVLIIYMRDVFRITMVRVGSRSRWYYQHFNQLYVFPVRYKCLQVLQDERDLLEETKTTHTFRRRVAALF